VRAIAHLSDLHFGREDRLLVEALVADLEETRPDLVVISGDLTQRARRAQFSAARAFLARVPAPTLILPGNHDIPLYDVLRRALRPLGRYRSYVTDDLAPLWSDDELAVLGVNTARPQVWKEGRISREQLAAIVDRFAALPSKLFRVLVTHHPFVPPPQLPRLHTVTRGLEALQAAEAAGTDLVLAGHLHLGYQADARVSYPALDRSILVFQAGTAISNRTRYQAANAYNRILVDPPHVTLEVREGHRSGFQPRPDIRYVKRAGAWVREG
jgi:3',5'-cyclic AMP phosphodiesterase CpdA